MENVASTITASEFLKLALSKASYWKNPYDPEQAAKIAEAIGSVTSETYFGILAEWKSAYAVISKESRETKPLRKGNNTVAMDRCMRLRGDAREHMAVRTALKAMARAHAAQRRLEIAA